MICTIQRNSIQRASVYLNGGKKTMAEIRRETGCQYILNGGLYNMQTFQPINHLTVDGAVLSAGGNPYGYAIRKDKFVFSYANNVKYPTFLGAYPVLVRDGKKNGEAAPAGLEGYRPRSCVGLTADGSVVLCCDQKNRSLDGIAGELVSAGCVTAIHLDGGGSRQCDFDGKSLTSSRIVHNYLCIWTKAEQREEEPKVGAKYKVCIDPGHGAGCANGSPDGSYKEHEFALDVGLRLKAVLERHGVDVVMTRTDGTDAALGQRAAISNRAGCDLFLSLHTNAYGTGWTSPEGWEAYVMAKGATAEKLAEAIRAEAIPALGCKDRGVKSANYTVLADTDAPAVLVEHGFHTNQAECAKLKSDCYRQLCAETNAKGILKILGISWEDGGDGVSFDAARQWVMEQGISDGTNPEQAATREQVWMMLYRLASK